MKIGGTARDGMMTIIPVAVAVFVAMILLGGPGEGLRALEQLSSDVWGHVVVLFRH